MIKNTASKAYFITSKGDDADFERRIESDGNHDRLGRLQTLFFRATPVCMYMYLSLVCLLIQISRGGPLHDILVVEYFHVHQDTYCVLRRTSYFCH